MNDEREIQWPEPREDPPEEPVEPWAKLVEHQLAEEIVEWEGWQRWRLSE
jgi:hypothetical protein